jgi:LCP family protein required for cell wall assembly
LGRRFAASRRRTWGQRAVLAVNALACVACLVIAGVLTWTWQRVKEIPRLELSGELAGAETAAAGGGQAQNVLIVGTDSADGLADDDPIRVGRDAGVRTDTVMLLRVDPSSEQAVLLSLPRDLYVPIAGTGGSAKINAALQGGGPARLVATVTDALDLPVHHYVEVNFAGFQDLVRAIGGVPVYFPEPVRDRLSGLEVPEAGCITLDPAQALAFVRSRAYEVRRDGRWQVDGSGDLGRISRQQDFIRRALHRAFERGARNPTVLADLVETGVGALTLDTTLSLGDLSTIALRFRSFDPERLLTYSLPVVDDTVGGAAVLRLDTRGAQPILDVFRGADPSLIAPDNTVVRILNGTTTAGLAEEAAAGLRAIGFVVPPDNTGDAESTQLETTTVRYIEGAGARAALVARALRADPVVEEVRSIVGADVAVVVAGDWAGVAEALRPATPGLVPGADEEATATTSVASTATTLPSTETTRRGEVPGPPPDGRAC